MESREAQERVGAHYDREQMLRVREMTLAGLHEIARAIRPGMIEEEAVRIGRQILKQAGLLRGWHRVNIRFGPNTLRTFSVLSEPGVVLGENDIFFIDIGPVWKKWEGDAGDTFVVGNDPDMHRAARDVRTIFERTQDRWSAEGLTGQALYAFAEAESARLGWQLNLQMNGHRVSDFPHEALFAGGLSTAEYTPKTELWILEIQIRHPERPFGAFYEDMLLKT